MVAEKPVVPPVYDLDLKFVLSLPRCVKRRHLERRVPRDAEVAPVETNPRDVRDISEIDLPDGLRVFLRFCAKREYMELIHIPMMKLDESFKDPYTDAELEKLLKRPTGDSFVEWRCWAAINTFLATGIRANTLVNIKISDVDFENDTIHLSKLKNRRQQFVPMSQSLKAALNIYLKLWDWNSDDYLFPANDGKQMPVSGIGGSIRRYNLSRGVSKTSMHLFRHTFAKN